jgi:hypothetical protein
MRKWTLNVVLKFLNINIFTSCSTTFVTLAALVSNDYPHDSMEVISRALRVCGNVSIVLPNVDATSLMFYGTLSQKCIDSMNLMNEQALLMEITKNV